MRTVFKATLLVVIGGMAIFAWRSFSLSGVETKDRQTDREYREPATGHSSSEIQELLSRIRQLEQESRAASTSPLLHVHGDSIDPVAEQDEAEVEPVERTREEVLAQSEGTFWAHPGRSTWSDAVERNIQDFVDELPGLISFDCRDVACRMEIRHEDRDAVESLVESLADNKSLFHSQIDYYWADNASLHQVIYIKAPLGDAP